MYINLREDNISVLEGFIGNKSLPEGCFRSGRIEYRQWQNNIDFFEVNFDEEEIQNIKNHKYEQEYYKTIKEHSNTKNYEEWKIKKYMEGMETTVRQDIHICQYFWITKDKIQATGLSFLSEQYIRTLLAQIFYTTDKFGEPNFEDTKTIEWITGGYTGYGEDGDYDQTSYEDEHKLIIVLPKKHSKAREQFSIVYGDKVFLEKMEIWKTNI